MGRRSTAQNYNLNRDYMKLDAPEMRAMQALLRQWDPVLMADLHTTDGAQFQPDVAVQIEPLHAGDAELATQGQALSDRLLGALRKQGAMPLPWYPTFLRRDEPASGFAANVYQPRFSTGYFQQRNRFAVLVETHSWKDYATRVRITRDFIVDLMAEAGRHGSAWLSAAHAADARSARLAGQPCRWTGRPPTRRGRSTSPATPTCAARPPFPVPSSSATTSASRSLESAAARTCRAIGAGHGAEGGLSGAGCAGRTGAATARPARHRVSPHRPSAVEAAGAGMADGQGHVCFRSVRGPADAQGGGCVEARAGRSGGRCLVRAERAAAGASGDGPAGADGTGFAAAWGQFNGMFEAKEYMESYVAEDVAREQLRDPAVAAEFAEKLKDPAFAADPRARLAFFIKRHPSWERELDLYPVYRLERRRMPLPCSDRADGAARASGR
jgi:hypothetical protein